MSRSSVVQAWEYDPSCELEDVTHLAAAWDDFSPAEKVMFCPQQGCTTVDRITLR